MNKHSSISKNKRVSFDYFIEEEWEAGISLTGSEIKSIRKGHFNIRESFVIFDPLTKQVVLHNAHIKEFSEASYNNHDPYRNRPLLLKKKEIRKIIGRSKQVGYTVKPIEAYFKGHLVKIKIALCKGKKNYDKRQSIKDREDKIRMDKLRKKAL